MENRKANKRNKRVPDRSQYMTKEPEETKQDQNKKEKAYKNNRNNK